MFGVLTMGFACSKPCHCWDEGSGSRPIPLEVIGVGGHPTAFSCFLRTPLSEDARPSCQPRKQVRQLRWVERCGSRPSPLEVFKGVAIPLPPVPSSEYLSLRKPLLSAMHAASSAQLASWRDDGVRSSAANPLIFGALREPHAGSEGAASSGSELQPHPGSSLSLHHFICCQADGLGNLRC